MKVILTADVKGTGQKNEVLNVSDGFARNYLFPRKWAVEASPAAVKEIERKHALEEKLEAQAKEMDEAGDNRSAQILNQLWEILLSALEQMYDVLGETHWEPEHFLRLFRLLLSQYDVDGGLIGGAALKPADFAAIVAAASK